MTVSGWSRRWAYCFSRENTVAEGLAREVLHGGTWHFLSTMHMICMVQSAHPFGFSHPKPRVQCRWFAISYQNSPLGCFYHENLPYVRSDKPQIFILISFRFSLSFETKDTTRRRFFCVYQWHSRNTVETLRLQKSNPWTSDQIDSGSLCQRAKTKDNHR